MSYYALLVDQEQTTESYRMVDALQHFEEYGEVCPANWSKGKDAMKATEDGVANYLSKH